VYTRQHKTTDDQKNNDLGVVPDCDLEESRQDEAPVSDPECDVGIDRSAGGTG
jgi:hypothetical protein